MSNGTKVKKRDGRIESLDLEKMHLMVEEACKDLANVSASHRLRCSLESNFMMVLPLQKFRRF